MAGEAVSKIKKDDGEYDFSECFTEEQETDEVKAEEGGEAATEAEGAEAAEQKEETPAEEATEEDK